MSGLTEDAIDRIAALATEAEGARVVTLSNGATILLNSRTDKDYVELTPPTKDAHGVSLYNPNSIKRKIDIQTADSLVDYITRFKTEGATLFADIAQNRIVAVLDYHVDGGDIGARLLDHVAVLTLPFAEEWKIWKGIDTKHMPQLEFARFIEENGVDIEAPDAAELLECCRDLQALRKVNFIKAVRTNTDCERFEYSEDNDLKTKGGVDVPTMFQLRLPVYFGGRMVEQQARLRWNVSDGVLTLGIFLSRSEYVRQAIFKETVEDIADRAKVPAIYGNPGSL
jgi:uncharacterized protein YfdQ (DUF2303 family)